MLCHSDALPPRTNDAAAELSGGALPVAVPSRRRERQSQQHGRGHGEPERVPRQGQGEKKRFLPPQRGRGFRGFCVDCVCSPSEFLTKNKVRRNASSLNYEERGFRGCGIVCGRPSHFFGRQSTRLSVYTIDVSLGVTKEKSHAGAFCLPSSAPPFLCVLNFRSIDREKGAAVPFPFRPRRRSGCGPL